MLQLLFLFFVFSFASGVISYVIEKIVVAAVIEQKTGKKRDRMIEIKEQRKYLSS